MHIFCRGKLSQHVKQIAFTIQCKRVFCWFKQEASLYDSRKFINRKISIEWCKSLTRRSTHFVTLQQFKILRDFFCRKSKVFFNIVIQRMSTRIHNNITFDAGQFLRDTVKRPIFDFLYKWAVIWSRFTIKGLLKPLIKGTIRQKISCV